MKLDFTISAVLSLTLHGAVAAGLYGTLFTGPAINFAAGNSGMMVSIVGPAEIGGGMSEESAEKTAADSGAMPASTPATEPEVTLKQIKAEKPKQSKPASQREKSGSLIPAKAISNSSDSTGLAYPGAASCAEGDCASRASLGLSGDSRFSGVGIVHAPKPPYPWEARRAGFEGSLLVTVDIAKDGRVKEALLSRSSGRDDCDRAALETIRERWRFEPARFLGRPIDWRENVEVVYTLRR